MDILLSKRCLIQIGYDTIRCQYILIIRMIQRIMEKRSIILKHVHN